MTLGDPGFTWLYWLDCIGLDTWLAMADTKLDIANYSSTLDDPDWVAIDGH